MQLDGKQLSAFPRLACIQEVDSPLVILALHGLQETDDGTLRRASPQGVVVGGLGLHGAFQHRGRLCLLGGLGAGNETSGKHHRHGDTDRKHGLILSRLSLRWLASEKLLAKP